MGFFSDIIEKKKAETRGSLPPLDSLTPTLDVDTPQTTPMSRTGYSPMTTSPTRSALAFPALDTVKDGIGRPSQATTNEAKISSDTARDVTISSGSPDPVEAGRAAGRSIPIIGPALFGRGKQSASNKLYPEGSIRQQLVEEGVVGFLQEGFLNTMNPTQEKVGQMLDEDYQKALESGIDERRAFEVAIQNVVDQVSPGAQNIQSLAEKAPNDLTEEEKELFFWSNLVEDTMTVLDAPIFFGTTKPVSEGAEQSLKFAGRKLSQEGNDKLAERAEALRDLIIERSATPPVIRDQVVDVVNGTDELAAYIDNLKSNANPSISFLNESIPVLSKAGIEATDIKRELADIIAEVKREPATYLRDPKTGQFRGSTPAIEPFENQGELTTSILTELEGKTSVSKQFISDLTNTVGRKKAENDVIREVLEEYEDGAKIPAKEFAEKVQARLLPLERNVAGFDEYGRYRSVSLPDDIKGDVTKYEERVYQSPIKNSAGDVHFSQEDIDNYFAHSRIEDMADNSTRRVIEVQSDLFQKGRLEKQIDERLRVAQEGRPSEYSDSFRERIRGEAEAELAQLQPYRNTWWERIIREEVKKAAQDGKSVLQFPTGETAMKIEGLGQQDAFSLVREYQGESQVAGRLTPENIKVGQTVTQGNQMTSTDWIITEVLEDGKFKAVPKNRYEYNPETWQGTKKEHDEMVEAYTEQFDISGKVDTSNPIYKFYEKDVQKYLTKNYGAKVVTDAQGVKWVQLDVTPTMADKPVEAFAGAIAGLEEDEEGNIEVDPAKAFLGMAAAGFLGKGFIKGRNQNRSTGALDDAANRRGPRTPQEKTPLPKVGQTEYPLTSEKVVSSLSEQYKTTTNSSIDADAQAIPLFDPQPEKLPIYSRFREGMSEAWTSTIEFLQDDMRRVRNLVSDPNVTVTDDTDPYLAEVLFHGRVGARLEATREQVLNIDKQIVRTAKQWGIPDQDMTLVVNKYLHARHAPERNARLGDGAAGLTDKEAAQILEQIDALPYANEAKAIADEIQTINNQTLDVLRETQVIDQETYDTLRSTYKNHVPLQRVLDDNDDMVGALTGRGFDVRGTGIKRAKGSNRQVADILANVVTNYEQAIIRAEKNRVDLTTLQFARDNAELGIFKELKARPIGKTFDGNIITEKFNDPRVLELRENGKPVYLKIADENLAIALKGVGRHQVPPMMRFIQTFTRFYSGLQTRFNPEFAFPNKIRDIQEAVVFAGSRKELGFRGGVQSALNQKAYKDVLDHIRGVDSEGAQLYKQMIEDGGTTGGMSLSTREAIELDIQQIRRLNRSNPRQAADKLIRTIDQFNQVVEDSTRLSIYKQALDRGVSRKRAAELAKESTVNFNKLGRGGPVINSLWMFSNASIQGTTKMLRAMKNPKVALVVTSSVAGAVWATSEWNETVDPNWRNKIPEWDRLNTLPVVLPTEDGSFRYIVIPVGWGIKPIKVMADYAFDAGYGQDVDVVDAFNGIGAAAINAYNPLGGTDVFSSVMPTILDIPSELARNKAWHGGKIKPDWDQNAPESIKYFSSLEDTATGNTTIAISKGLSGMGIEVSPADIMYAYQGYIGGAGRTANDTVNTIAKATRFEMPEAKDVPVASRFYKVRDNEEIGAASKEHEDIKKLLEEQSRERFYLKQDAEDAYLQLKELPQNEAAARFDEIAAQDEDLAKAIADIKKSEDLGLTYTQRLIMQLGVSNGERAEYIYKKLQELPSDEMRADLWNEYTEKKIISNNVADQLLELINK